MSVQTETKQVTITVTCALAGLLLGLFSISPGGTPPPPPPPPGYDHWREPPVPQDDWGLLKLASYLEFPSVRDVLVAILRAVITACVTALVTWAIQREFRRRQATGPDPDTEVWETAQTGVHSEPGGDTDDQSGDRAWFPATSASGLLFPPQAGIAVTHNAATIGDHQQLMRTLITGEVMRPASAVVSVPFVARRDILASVPVHDRS